MDPPSRCARSTTGTLATRGVQLISGPTDHDFGHRTLFFRDPDGNVLEIHAEIDLPSA
jgi:catechol 2,3-dioxygenase-like lactoylglutathione lyase family enzyme